MDKIDANLNYISHKVDLSSQIQKDWTNFSEYMEGHIKHKGHVYDHEGISCKDIQTWEGPLNDAFKYLWEILAWLKNNNIDVKAIQTNLLKTAHCAQIAYQKLEKEGL
jgi:hypothetical protein